MTLSLHKLWAGSGYEYLTRQVARLDATHAGRAPLASYYSERGETPGVWMGSGLSGISGLQVGGLVSAEQMRLLFGQGRHPLADERVKVARASGQAEREAERAGLLGVPFRARCGPAPFDVEVARRVSAIRAGTKLPTSAGRGSRAEVVSEVASEWFARDHGRSPADDRELAAAVARYGSRGQPVAGFDLTFSPVKSVSALWALAAPSVAAEVEVCHRAAVADALSFVEERALFSREGARGVRQVEVTGLVGCAFTHRDSRAGDPDLHTHVAVANKVQTRSGKWLAIDGRVLYAATVAASETYNTALEHHLRERLGLRFAARPSGVSLADHPTAGQREVRELVGVDERLLQRWSARRSAIDARRAALARDFHARTGRPPDRREAWALAQQATLDTRPAKHEPRTVIEQRTRWAAQAADLLGSQRAVDAMVDTILNRSLDNVDAAVDSTVDSIVDADGVTRCAAAVVAALEGERATWGMWHVHAEAQRQVRTLNVPPGMTGHVADLVVGETLNRCVLLAPPAGIDVPPILRRSDGTSVYAQVGSRRWTSQRVLTAEQRLLSVAGLEGGRRVDPATVEAAISRAGLGGPTLNPGQAGLVRAMAGSGRRLQLALAPAGTGKTTALRVLADAWATAGGRVVGLAPSAAAAAVLAEQLSSGPRDLRDRAASPGEVPTDTLAKFVWTLDNPHGVVGGTAPDWIGALSPRSLVLVDEAGLADSPSLVRAVEYVLGVGGSVRLVGDDQQLGAVGAGGILRDLADRHGATRLKEVVRFVDPAESAASLALRDGRPEALGFYLDQRRIHVGDPTTAVDQAFAAWTADRASGLDTLMLAPTRSLVSELNRRARDHRLAATRADGSAATAMRTPDTTVILADENEAGPGDTLVTRSNHRGLRPAPTGDAGAPSVRLRSESWVRNGDRWTVARVLRDGGLDVVSLDGRRTLRLPAAYVAASVELGYATTIHAAQGSTCDTVHGVLTGAETRAQLYTLLTRGRIANHAYLQLDGGSAAVTDDDGPAATLAGPDRSPARTATQTLEQILGREADDSRSATGTQTDLHDPARRLPDAVDAYLDGLHAGAEAATSPQTDHEFSATAERLLPGVTDEAAWPTLRSRLLLDAARGHDPRHTLTLAVATSGLTSAAPGPGRTSSGPPEPGSVRDLAAVLHDRVGRLHPLNRPDGGPVSGVPPVPDRLLDDPAWGTYLTACANLVADLADRVRRREMDLDDRTGWRQHLPFEDGDLRGDVAVWRAARRIPDTEPRPLGSPPRRIGDDPDYEHLASRLKVPGTTASRTGAVAALETLAVGSETRDPFSEELVRRLGRLSAAGVDVGQAMRDALAGPALPDDHPSAAVWWRLHRHLPPGTLGPTPESAPEPTVDPPSGLALERGDPGRAASTAASTASAPELQPAASGTRGNRLDVALLVAGILRTTRTTRSNTSGDEPSLGRAAELAGINELALGYYRSRYAGSWAAQCLAERVGSDLASDTRFEPGYAPAGWTHLVDHLRWHGVTDHDLVAAGLACRTSRGTVVDRFRDRLILPIRSTDGRLVGFVARRHDRTGEQNRLAQTRSEVSAGPKYLNTPCTDLYAKHDHLFGGHLLTGSRPESPVRHAGADPYAAIPVVVEGPIDAVAVTLAGDGKYVGVASLGTAVSAAQASLLRTGPDPVLAFDPDTAGQAAARRAFWTLAAAGLDPQTARLPRDLDPAFLFEHAGADGLRQALRAAEPLAGHMIRATDPEPADRPDFSTALRVAAARPPRTWRESIERLAEHAQMPTDLVGERLLHHVRTLDHEVRRGTPTQAEPERSAGLPRPGLQTAVPDRSSDRRARDR